MFITHFEQKRCTNTALKFFFCFVYKGYTFINIALSILCLLISKIPSAKVTLQVHLYI